MFTSLQIMSTMVKGCQYEKDVNIKNSTKRIQNIAYVFYITMCSIIVQVYILTVDKDIPNK